jgi:4-oxalomesaconate tautomerase
VVRRSARDGIDVDYLFLQVFVDQAIVTDAQNCGNILAGVGPFAIERGLVAPGRGDPPCHLHGEHRPGRRRHGATPGGVVTYAGDARIDGVPGTSAPIPLDVRDTAGSVVRRAAAHRQRGRCDRRRRGDADRQRHALRQS